MIQWAGWMSQGPIRHSATKTAEEFFMCVVTYESITYESIPPYWLHTSLPPPSGYIPMDSPPHRHVPQDPTKHTPPTHALRLSSRLCPTTPFHQRELRAALL
eukprot:GHVO01003812.1.p1 GENE.GHVO01003812.1~~GHVO01003812.1.p1  ORF type:complete len:102 (+),score=16.26 GHVO01003812.1:63-368(+)